MPPQQTVRKLKKLTKIKVLRHSLGENAGAAVGVGNQYQMFFNKNQPQMDVCYSLDNKLLAEINSQVSGMDS